MANQEVWTNLDGVKVGVLKNRRLNPLSTAERIALGLTLNSSHKGLSAYDTDQGVQYYWDGAVWGTTAVAAQSYTHIQGVPSAIWTINHGLGFRPGGVTVIDSSGRTIISDISYDPLNVNIITLTFAGALSGKAYIS